MNEFDPTKYTIIVKKQSVDEEIKFTAQVIEFPTLLSYGDKFEEAYQNMLETITYFHEDSIEDKTFFPQPLSLADDYSGRLTLRLPKSLHKQIELQAVMEGVSLNQFVVTALSNHSCHKSTEKHLMTFLKDLKIQTGLIEDSKTPVNMLVSQINVNFPNLPNSIASNTFATKLNQLSAQHL